jgi:hypothetical protein
VVDTIDLSGFPLPMMLQVHCSGRHGAHLVVTMYVHERESHKLIPVDSHAYVPDASPDTVLRTARDAVLKVVEHEVLEQFKVEGKRVFDPHLQVPPSQSKTVWMTVELSPPPEPPPAPEPPPQRPSEPAADDFDKMTYGGYEFARGVVVVKDLRSTAAQGARGQRRKRFNRTR